MLPTELLVSADMHLAPGRLPSPPPPPTTLRTQPPPATNSQLQRLVPDAPRALPPPDQQISSELGIKVFPFCLLLRRKFERVRKPLRHHSLPALPSRGRPSPTPLTIGSARGCAAPLSSRKGCWRCLGKVARSRCPRCRSARSGPPGTAAASPPPGRWPFGDPVLASLPQPCALGGEHSTPNGTIPELCGMRRRPKGRRPQEKRLSSPVPAGRREGGREEGRDGRKEGGEVGPRAEQSEAARDVVHPPAGPHARFLPQGGADAPALLGAGRWVGSRVWC